MSRLKNTGKNWKASAASQALLACFLASVAGLGACVPSGVKSTTDEDASFRGASASGLNGPVHSELQNAVRSAKNSMDILKIVARSDEILSKATSSEIESDPSGYWLASGLRFLGAFQSAAPLLRKVLNGQDQHITENALVTGLVTLANAQKIFFSGEENGAALLRYLALPTGKVTPAHQFTSASDWQSRWLCNSGTLEGPGIPGLLSAVTTLIGDAEKFAGLARGGFWIDASVGLKDFNPLIDEGRGLVATDFQMQMGEPEHLAVLAGLYGLRSSILASCAYKSDQVNLLAEAVVMGYAFDTIPLGTGRGFAARDRIGILGAVGGPLSWVADLVSGQARAKNLAARANGAGTLVEGATETWLKPSLFDARSAAWLQMKAVESALDRSPSANMMWVLDRDRLAPMERQLRILSKRVASIWEVEGLSGSSWPQARASVESAVANPEHTVQFVSLARQNRTVSFKPYVFFVDPPRDLRVLLPESFESLSSTQLEEGVAWGSTYDRNYRDGSVNAWKTDYYGRILPGASQADVGERLQTLNESVGGFLAGLPLSALTL